jgi:hypothetical protein
LMVKNHHWWFNDTVAAAFGSTSSIGTRVHSVSSRPCPETYSFGPSPRAPK